MYFRNEMREGFWFDQGVWLYRPRLRKGIVTIGGESKEIKIAIIAMASEGTYNDLQNQHHHRHIRLRHNISILCTYDFLQPLFGTKIRANKFLGQGTHSLFYLIFDFPLLARASECYWRYHGALPTIQVRLLGLE